MRSSLPAVADLLRGAGGGAPPDRGHAAGDPDSLRRRVVRPARPVPGAARGRGVRRRPLAGRVLRRRRGRGSASSREPSRSCTRAAGSCRRRCPKAWAPWPPSSASPRGSRGGVPRRRPGRDRLAGQLQFARADGHRGARGRRRAARPRRAWRVARSARSRCKVSRPVSLRAHVAGARAHGAAARGRAVLRRLDPRRHERRRGGRGFGRRPAGRARPPDRLAGALGSSPCSASRGEGVDRALEIGARQRARGVS
jgi:hypothetical protein